jgi:hypothetical protein
LFHKVHKRLKIHNLIPIEYSLDNGETWKKITVTKEKEEITPKLLELINKRKKTGSWYNREEITLSEYNFLRKLIIKSQKEFDNFIKSSKLDNEVIETIIDKDYIHLSDNAKYHILVTWRIKDEEKNVKVGITIHPDLSKILDDFSKDLFNSFILLFAEDCPSIVSIVITFPPELIH